MSLFDFQVLAGWRAGWRGGGGLKSMTAYVGGERGRERRRWKGGWCINSCRPTLPFYLFLLSKRILGNYWSHHHQTLHGNCIRYGNASRVNYILTWTFIPGHRAWIKFMLIISETKQKGKKSAWLKAGQRALGSLPLSAMSFCGVDFESIYLPWTTCYWCCLLLYPVKLYVFQEYVCVICCV